MDSAAASSGKTKKRDYGKPPNRLLYFFARFLLKIFVKPYFHVEWSIDPRIASLTGPVIILGNHPSYLDPFLLGCAMYPIKINFLASSIFFRNKYFEPLLYRAGVIPKTQFRADPGAVKAMLKVVKRGGILGIYPEGARSIDGTGLPIEDSITKFIKKVGGAVVTGISKGSYFTWPRWSESGFRRGRIHIDIGILFTKDEVADHSLQDLHAKILSAFAIDENVWQKTAMIPFRSKAPAKGLHNVLHQCPRCMECWATDTEDDRLFCRICGNTAVIDTYGFLHPQDASSVAFETIREWNLWQIDNISKEIASGNYSLSDDADLLVSLKDEPYAPSGSGVISLDKEGFLFKGIFKDEPIEKAFPLAGVLGIISDYGLNIALVSDQFTYLFILKNGQKAISYNHAQDILRKIAAGNEI
ncbi:MAG: 1-acyl-sn-glycerol-3-phosphate acyltransferase [Saccharofermentanales bacterium]